MILFIDFVLTTRRDSDNLYNIHILPATKCISKGDKKKNIREHSLKET